MISEMLPQRLFATKGMRFNEGKKDDKFTLDEEPIALDRPNWPERFVSGERFNFEVARPIKIEDVLTALEQVCKEHGATLWLGYIQKDFSYSNAMVEIGRRGHSREKAKIFVEGNFVSFTTLPS